jgi:hypothetical protein
VRTGGPSSCPIARNDGLRRFLLPATANMLAIATCSDQKTHQRIIIARIQAQVLRMFSARLRTNDDDPIQGGTEQLAIMAVGSIDDDRQGNPCPISRASSVWSRSWRDRWDWVRSRLARKGPLSSPHQRLATLIGGCVAKTQRGLHRNLLQSSTEAFLSKRGTSHSSPYLKNRGLLRRLVESLFSSLSSTITDQFSFCNRTCILQHNPFRRL